MNVSIVFIHFLIHQLILNGKSVPVEHLKTKHKNKITGKLCRCIPINMCHYSHINAHSGQRDVIESVTREVVNI